MLKLARTIADLAGEERVAARACDRCGGFRLCGHRVVVTDELGTGDELPRAARSLGVGIADVSSGFPKPGGILVQTA